MPLILQHSLALLARPLLFLVYFAVGFWPRNPRRWVFGSWSGYRYADNGAALFEHLNAARLPNVTAIWITRDPQIRARLVKRGLRAELAWSPRGLWACATAGIFIFDGLTKDINHWLSRGARRVLLRHGVGMKRVERALDNPRHRLYQLFHGNTAQRVFWSTVIPWHLVRPDLAIATSPEHVRQGELYYGLPADRFVVTGFPRNDAMLAGTMPAENDPDAIWIIARQQAGRRVFIYMPTFRDDAGRFTLPWRELDAMASRLGIGILIKQHFVDSHRGMNLPSGPLEHVGLAQPDRDPNRLFTLVDGLISDYSSASFDFILTRKPVVYFIPDENEYRKFSRGLLYDFDSVTPGPKARTLDALEVALARARDGQLKAWDDQYASVLDRFHSWRDPGASRRTLDEICRRYLPEVISRRAAQDQAGLPETD